MAPTSSTVVPETTSSSRSHRSPTAGPALRGRSRRQSPSATRAGSLDAAGYGTPTSRGFALYPTPPWTGGDGAEAFRPSSIAFSGTGSAGIHSGRDMHVVPATRIGSPVQVGRELCAGAAPVHGAPESRHRCASSPSGRCLRPVVGRGDEPERVGREVHLFGVAARLDHVVAVVRPVEAFRRACSRHRGSTPSRAACAARRRRHGRVLHR